MLAYTSMVTMGAHVAAIRTSAADFHWSGDPATCVSVIRNTVADQECIYAAAAMLFFCSCVRNYTPCTQLIEWRVLVQGPRG